MSSFIGALPTRNYGIKFTSTYSSEEEAHKALQELINYWEDIGKAYVEHCGVFEADTQEQVQAIYDKEQDLYVRYWLPLSEHLDRMQHFHDIVKRGGCYGCKPVQFRR
jgi:hypothetical protein